MQKAIKADMEGKSWMQLALFEEADDRNSVIIGVPLSEIAAPQHYKEVVAAFSDLRKIDYTLESVAKKGYMLYTGLLESFEAPIKENGKSVIYVKIAKGVARDLIEISKNERGEPMAYTRYLYDVVTASKSKYTWKIYTLISSWKSKGGFRIQLEKFRSVLGLGEDEYLNFADLKKRVIIPAQKDLFQKADCWFECGERGFEEKKGRKVVGLNFKVITPDIEEFKQDRKEAVYDLLRRHFGFTPTEIKQIQPIMTGQLDFGAIMEKIVGLSLYLEEHKGEIKNAKKYVVASLLKEFAGKVPFLS
jgi:hypothetical protein